MKRKHRTEEQIISILKEHAARTPAPEPSRRPGIAEGANYRWRSKFGGMEISEAKRLLAEADVDKTTLKKLVGEK